MDVSVYIVCSSCDSHASHYLTARLDRWFLSYSRLQEWTTGFDYLLNLAKRYYDDPKAPLPSFMKNHGNPTWEMLDELTIFLAASFESTAHTVAQALVMLSKDSIRQNKAAEEAKKIMQLVGDGPIRKEHVDACPYIQHCIFEALRLHPTIPFSARKMKEGYSMALLDGSKLDVPGGNCKCS